MSEEVILKELQEVKNLLKLLVERNSVKHFYSTEELAKLLGKAEFTVREWCRLGRIRAEKKQSGRGKHASWVISHSETLRIQQEGLLPLKDVLPTVGRSR
jgi:transposase